MFPLSSLGLHPGKNSLHGAISAAKAQTGGCRCCCRIALFPFLDESLIAIRQGNGATARALLGLMHQFLSTHGIFGLVENGLARDQITAVVMLQQVHFWWHVGKK